MSPLNSPAESTPEHGCDSRTRDDGAVPAGAPVRAARWWWRSIEDHSPSPELLRAAQDEFAPGASDAPTSEERRTFMKLAGASMALAGMGLAACRRWPESKLVPFASQPSNRVPGVPVRYATAMEIAGVGSGMVATSYDGRPIKLDGNAESWSGAGSSTFGQARILEMYDPIRSRTVLHQGKPSNHAAFMEWAGGAFKEFRASGGEGLAFLTEAWSGPTMDDARERLVKAFPKATWTTWEALAPDECVAGLAAAMGSARRPIHDFSKADVVVSLDSDFLNACPLSVRNAREFARTRRCEETDPRKQNISRLYAFESNVTVTGMNADERFAVKSGDVAALAAALCAKLGAGAASPALQSAVAALAATRDPAKLLGGDRQQAWDALVADLQKSRGRCLVLCGPRQPAAVHAMCVLLNDFLGNAGTTVRYGAPLAGCRDGMARLAADLGAGKVKTLVILGCNPVYTAPADLDFGALMAKAGTVVRLGLMVDETSRSQACTWHLPAAHFLESWGDVRTWDGSICMQQPLILPMIDAAQGGHSPLELLAILENAGVEKPGPVDGYTRVREVHMARSKLKGPAFEDAWRGWLDRGVVRDTAAAPEARPAIDPASAARAIAAAVEPSTAAAGKSEIVLAWDMKVFDGRYGTIGWLQELPDPVTKITWDNAALMSVATATRLGVTNGDMVTLSANGRSVEAAVWRVPGHADDSVTIYLGYGRGDAAGPIAANAGFNAYRIRTSGGMDILAGGTVAKAAGRYAFAHTQDHGVSEAVMPEVPAGSIQDRLPTLVRQGTLEEYREHPDFARHVSHVAHRLSLWEETNLDGAAHRWAMSIDLGACTGCSACMVACQAENNIPVVGKDQVARGREMHWLRIDRYFRGRDPAHPQGFAIAPVTCMQCENAPCEQVCPVGATLHDAEGINNMVYNRCVGTRYCSNNCPYKVRRFNFFDYQRRPPIREQEGPMAVRPEYYVETGPDQWLRMQFNPEVTVRMRGVMEKCTFCTQRIQAAKIQAKNAWARAGGSANGGGQGPHIPDGTIRTACQDACPAEAIVFGDLLDPTSQVSRLHRSGRSYQMLEELNTKTRVRYLARVNNPAVQTEGGGGHGHDHDHDHAGGKEGAVNG